MDPFLTGYFLIKGIAIGLIVAAPIGPVNLLVMQRTLAHGRLNGLATGMGATAGDGVFAVVAAFGISAVSTFVLAWIDWIQAIGAAIVCVMGLRMMVARPRVECVEGGQSRLPQAVASTFLLTITNPMTMLGFAALFAGVGGLGGAAGDMGSALSISAGVMLGSTAWWLAVALGVGLVRKRLDEAMLRLINRISGSIIILFGVSMLARLVLNDR